MILVTEKVTEMELVTIQENQGLYIKQSVDARELYQALGLDKSQWSRWHKQNIAENPFAIDGEDFEGFDMMSNGNWTQNYVLSIDFAKKLAMQVRTEKGEQVRDYFLECERKVTQSSPVIALPDFTNPAAAARAWADEVEAKLFTQEQLAIAQPKADALDYISTAVNSLNARDTAKTLGIQPQKFNKWCVAHGWMYRDSKSKLQMCSNRLQQGFMEQRNVTYHNSNGDLCATTQPMFTAKGLTHLAGIFSIVHEMA